MITILEFPNEILLEFVQFLDFKNCCKPSSLFNFILTDKNFEDIWTRLYLEARETRLNTFETKGIYGPGLGAKLKAKRIAQVKIRNGL